MNELEKKITNYLHNVCAPNSTPISKLLFDNGDLFLEDIGLCVHLYGIAFDLIRFDLGNEWIFTKILPITNGPNKNYTKNKIIEIMQRLENSKFLEYFHLEGTILSGKFNVISLFGDVPIFKGKNE